MSLRKHNERNQRTRVKKGVDAVLFFSRTFPIYKEFWRLRIYSLHLKMYCGNRGRYREHGPWTWNDGSWDLYQKTQLNLERWAGGLLPKMPLRGLWFQLSHKCELQILKTSKWISKILVSKINLTSQEMSYLTKYPFSISLLFSI